jgi:fatty acid desaturase
MHASEGIQDAMSKGTRWMLAIVLLALGALLFGVVGPVPGVIVMVLGVLVMPWFAGMGA